MVKSDLSMIGMKYDETYISSMTKYQFKRLVKQRIDRAAFIYLLELKYKHSKIKDINYDRFTTQDYLISSEFTNEEINFIYLMRSKTISCKSNFKSLYNTNVLCDLCMNHPDDQRFFTQCEVIKQNLPKTVILDNISHDQLFGNSTEQKKFITWLRKRSCCR